MLSIFRLGAFLLAFILSLTGRAFNFIDAESAKDILRSTKELMSPSMIGTQKGFELKKSVGIAKLSQKDGSFIVHSNKRSNCTTATHAVFLKTLASLNAQGKIKLSQKTIRTLNSPLFWNIWNSNGYGPLKLIDDLGGTVFDKKDLKALKPGDFVKLDRKKSGHMVIFTRFKGSQICYWSSNKSTKGLGETCRSTSSSLIRAGRLPSLNTLSANLDSLAEKMQTGSAYADVRKRGGGGYVAFNTSINKYSSRHLASAFHEGAD